MKSLLLLIAFLASTTAFVTPNINTKTAVLSHATQQEYKSLLVLSAEKKNKGSLDKNVRSKLVSESIAPWRTLRLFLYGALGSGAFLGGMITLSGAAAVASGARDGDLNTELLNLAIDFGAVAAFALLAKFDLGKQKELDEKVNEKMAQKKEQSKKAKGMKQRELELGRLRLDVQVSADGTTKDAAVKELQAGARQHMILVIGPRKACRDALVGANLLKMDFAMNNILVVPYEIGTDAAKLASRPEGGFGDRPMYETQPYVARPTGEGWEEYVAAELKDAVDQNGEKAKEEGIAIVVASTGKVIRRGIGKIPWRTMVEELDTAVGGGPKKEPSLF